MDEGVGGMATLSRSMSAWTVPVKVWKYPGMTPVGMPVRRMATRSARFGVPRVVGGQVRERARVEHGQELGQLGVGEHGR